MVLLPDPDGPTIAVTCPAGNITLSLSRTLTLGLVGYAKVTSLNTMSSLADTSGSLKPVEFGAGVSIVAKKPVEELAAFEMAASGLKIPPKVETTMRTEKNTLPKSACQRLVSTREM